MTESSNAFKNYCRFSPVEWEQHKLEVNRITENLRETSANTKSTAELIEKINNELLAAVTGKQYMQMETATDLMKQQKEAYTTVIKIQSWVFGTIILVLLGLKYLVPDILGG